MKKVINVVKANKYIIETEPDLEGNAVKALFFDGIEQYIKVVKEKEFIEIFEGKKIELPCFDDHDLKNIYIRNNLKVILTDGIQLFPSLLRIGDKKQIIIGSEKIPSLESKIRNTFDYFNNKGKLYKHKLWYLKKV